MCDRVITHQHAPQFRMCDRKACHATHKHVFTFADNFLDQWGPVELGTLERDQVEKIWYDL
jgi:hypothetical protein